MSSLQVASISTTNLTIQGIISANSYIASTDVRSNTFTGNSATISTITAGNVTGNVIGNLTGNVTGNVIGNLTGNVTGNVIGNLTGNVVASSITANSFIANTMNVGNLVLSGSFSSTSTLSFNNTTLTGNVFANGSYQSNITVVPSLDIDCRLGNFFTKTISTSSAFTFSNVPTSRAYSATLEVTHTTGTITWPAAVRWPLNTAPTLTTSRTHLFMFVTDDGGTTWRGSALVDYTA